MATSPLPSRTRFISPHPIPSLQGRLRIERGNTHRETDVEYNFLSRMHDVSNVEIFRQYVEHGAGSPGMISPHNPNPAHSALQHGPF